METNQPKKPLTEKEKIFVFLNHEKMCVNAMVNKIGVSAFYINQFMKRHDLKPVLRIPRKKQMARVGYFNEDDLKNMY